MNEAETRAEHIDPALAAAGRGVVEAKAWGRSDPALRFSRCRCGLAALMLVAQLSWAQAPAEPPASVTPASAESGRVLRDRSAAMQADAERQLEADKAACYLRTFPNGCLQDAKERHAVSLKQARRLDQQGVALEREARNRERAERDQQRAVEAEREAVERPLREQKFREEKARKDASREARRAADEAQLAQRRAKAPESAAAKAARAAEAAQKDADIARKHPAAVSKQAEKERKHAERAAKIDAKKKEYAEKLKYREAENARRLAEEEAARKNAEKSSPLRCLLSGEGCAKPAAK